MKLERREIAVLIVMLVAGVTANAWWRVKETGRRARIVALREALLDAGTAEDAAEDAGDD